MPKQWFASQSVLNKAYPKTYTKHTLTALVKCIFCYIYIVKIFRKSIPYFDWSIPFDYPMVRKYHDKRTSWYKDNLAYWECSLPACEWCLNSALTSYKLRCLTGSWLANLSDQLTSDVTSCSVTILVLKKKLKKKTLKRPWKGFVALHQQGMFFPLTHLLYSI